MNSPDGELGSGPFERFAPSEDVLINAVNQCAVKVEEKRRGYIRRFM